MANDPVTLTFDPKINRHQRSRTAVPSFKSFQSVLSCWHKWLDGWLGFNGILSTQVAAISCLKEL